jgi:hypothetical protein
MRCFSLASRLLFVLSVFCNFIWAQSSTTSLRGTVVDPKGAVIADAKITLANPATGFTRTTNTATDGVYQFLQVPPATYTLTVEAHGFATLKQDYVTLVQQTVRNQVRPAK